MFLLLSYQLRGASPDWVGDGGGGGGNKVRDREYFGLSYVHNYKETNQL